MQCPEGGPKYHKPSKEEQAVFDEAFKGFVGVAYKAGLVKSQVVNGINYVFIANATFVYPGGEDFKAQVSIYKPIRGAAVLKDITRKEK